MILKDMSKNPTIHALLAAAYIIAIVSVMQFAEKAGVKETIIIPIAMLSLFTLSAAVMGYLFLLQPIQLFLDGKKKEAVTFFLQTVGMFAIMTFVFLVAAFSGLFAR